MLRRAGFGLLGLWRWRAVGGRNVGWALLAAASGDAFKRDLVIGSGRRLVAWNLW
jgi:hypothetical protein